MKIGMLTGRTEYLRSCGKQRGFTLIEVILVLVIVSVLTAVILSNNGATVDSAKLNGEVDLIKTQLRYAQARSLNANEVWGMKADNTGLWLFRDGDENDKTPLPGESGDVVHYDDTDDRKKGLRIAPFLVSFDDRGRPCTDATGTTLSDADTRVTVTVSYGSSPGTDITITPNTGFIQ